MRKIDRVHRPTTAERHGTAPLLGRLGRWAGAPAPAVTRPRPGPLRYFGDRGEQEIPVQMIRLAARLISVAVQLAVVELRRALRRAASDRSAA